MNWKTQNRLMLAIWLPYFAWAFYVAFIAHPNAWVYLLYTTTVWIPTYITFLIFLKIKK